MTQWGMLLLCVYIALGVGRASWRRAGVIAVIATGAVLAIVLVSYTHTTPQAKYYRAVDAPVYATGVSNTQPNSPNAEDTSGVTPAGPANTVENTNAGGQSSSGNGGS